MLTDTKYGVYEFDEFRVDVGKRLIFRSGKSLAIQPKAFDLLVELIEKRDFVSSKDELMSSVWGEQFVEESNLAVQIAALRKLFGERKDGRRFIVNIPGKGYRFIANVRESFANASQVATAIADDKEVNRRRTGPKSLDYDSRPKKLRLVLASVALVFMIFAAAGLWFFYSGENKADVDLHIAGVESEQAIRRLTNSGRVLAAIISPNGKFFAYSSRERGSHRTELRIGQVDGTGDISLIPLNDEVIFPRAFSADNSWLYYSSGEFRRPNGSLFKIPVLGGIPQRLAFDVDVLSRLSPDQSKIAFVRTDKERQTSSLRVSNINGSGEREIATRPFMHSFVSSECIAWKNDGKSIVAGAATPNTGKPGNTIGYELFVVGVEDGNVTQLTDLSWNEITRLEWLNDGTGIVIEARDEDRFTGGQLWKIDYPATRAKKISHDLNSAAGSLSIADDSRTLVSLQSESETNLWIGEKNDLESARQITFSSSGRLDGWFGIDLADDGRIVYTAWIDQSLTIWIMNDDGSNAKQLTALGFRDERPVVSNDGRRVVFQSNRSGGSEIWCMDIDGSNLKQVSRVDGASSPSLTPDGEWVVFRRIIDGQSSIWRMPINGGEPIQITENESSVPSVSPDGKFIACSYRTNETTFLAVVPITGGEPTRLFPIPKTANFRYWIRWTPDGASITYPDETNGIWSQSIEGGEPIRLPGIPAEKTFAHSWSSNGKLLVFGRAREVRDAVLIIDF